MRRSRWLRGWWIPTAVATMVSCSLDLNPQPEPPGDNGYHPGDGNEGGAAASAVGGAGFQPGTGGSFMAVGAGGSAANTGTFVWAGGATSSSAGEEGGAASVGGAADVAGGTSAAVEPNTGGVGAIGTSGIGAMGGAKSTGGVAATGGAKSNGGAAQSVVQGLRVVLEIHPVAGLALWIQDSTQVTRAVPPMQHSRNWTLPQVAACSIRAAG